MEITRMLGVLLIGATTLAASPARATPFSWEFSGSIRKIDQFGLPDSALLAELETAGVALGATVTGSVTFDPAVLDVDPSEMRSQLSGAILSFDLNVGSLEMQALANPLINIVSVINDDPNFFADRMLVATEGSIGSYGTQILGLQLVDSDGLVFGSDVIPGLPPDVADLDPFPPGAQPFQTEITFAVPRDDALYFYRAR